MMEQNQPTTTPPPAIPDHQLLRCIGRGSYGAVWLARNMMGNYRAVKIVYRSSFSDQRPFDRELSGIRKFEPISRSHEGFVDVLHVGINEAEGYFYYVMELGDDPVTGTAIDPEKYVPNTLGKQMAKGKRLPFEECLRLGLALSQALDVLHKHGLVHRDIKPSNIIFVNGIPKLADIGLVAEASEARSYVGTEGFIPPEGPGSPQGDIFALGKVLYEMSTGKDRHEFPELPTQLGAFPDSEKFLELNEIILHACSNDADDRYPSAWEMHGHLLLIANGESVKRLRLLERRLTTLKRAAGVAGIVLLATTAVLFLAYREWKRTDETRQQRVGSDVATANRAIEGGDMLGALPYIADALRLDEGRADRERAHGLRFDSVVAQCPKMTHLWSLDKPANDGEFSPDGKKALIAEYQGQVRIYDLETDGLYRQPFGGGNLLKCASYNRDGRLIVTAHEEGAVRIWNATTLEKIGEAQCYRPLCAQFSPDGSRIIIGSTDGSVLLWTWQESSKPRTLPLKHGKPVRFAAFSHDEAGRLVATASADGAACVWDSTDGHLVCRMDRPGTWMMYAAFSPDNKRVVTGSSDGVALVWDAETGQRLPGEMVHDDLANSAEFSPDGRLILTACSDGIVRLWDAATLRPYEGCPVLRCGRRAMHASFSPDGRCILATCTDGSVSIWDLAGIRGLPPREKAVVSRDGSRILAFAAHGFVLRAAGVVQSAGIPLPTDGAPEAAEFSLNSRYFLSTSLVESSARETNHLLQIRDASTGAVCGPAIVLSNSIAGARPGNDGQHVLVWSGNQVEIWDAPAQRIVTGPLMHDEEVTTAQFSPDCLRVVTASGVAAHLWNATNAHEITLPLLHSTRVAFAEFSPKGDFLGTCCFDQQYTACYAQVWNGFTGERIGPHLDHGDGVVSLSFSSDGRRLITTGEDHIAVVWDTITGRQLTPALRQKYTVRGAAMSPDDEWVVSAGDDHRARIWESGNGMAITPPFVLPEPLTGARFLANGRRLATFSGQNGAWIWDLTIVQRPVQDVSGLARLLSAGTVTVPGDVSGPTPEPMEILWKRFRKKYPEMFSVSVAEIARWYDSRAEENLATGQWRTAAFYLTKLSALEPQDDSVSERLKMARERLGPQN